jgi:hypothetical protein
MSGDYKITCGPFAKTRKDIDSFCHNLFMSYAVSEAVNQMIEAENEHKKAIISNDTDAIKKTEFKLSAYKSSLLLTAHMLSEIDEVST